MLCKGATKIMRCTCNKDTSFQGNDVKAKVDTGLKQLDFGHSFGEVLYVCTYCEQHWEKNLSQATHHDWPPILVKLSKEEAQSKYCITNHSSGLEDT